MVIRHYVVVFSTHVVLVIELYTVFLVACSMVVSEPGIWPLGLTRLGRK